MKMYKGGTPAKYGGRSSSVLDLRMKDGNSKRFKASGGVGLLSSRLMLEGPIVKDKGSFMISGRRTYLDLFFPLSSDSKVKDSKLYFYDLNIKANYRFGDKDRIFLSSYLGRDVFSFDNKMGFNWGNITSTVRWNHLFSNKFFLNTTFLYSKYDYDMLLNNTNMDMTLKSGIETYAFKQDYTCYITNDYKVDFGVSLSKKKFTPGEFNKNDGTIKDVIQISESNVLENGLYVSNSLNIGSSLKVEFGARFSMFNVLGGRDFYTYEPNGEISNTEYKKSSEIVKTYYGFEPRFMATYILDEESSVKFSYNRMNQYVHLMSNTTSGSPTDYWVPSSPNINPQISDQISAGYFRNFDENKI